MVTAWGTSASKIDVVVLSAIFAFYLHLREQDVSQPAMHARFQAKADG